MDDILTWIIGLIISAILMFIFPLMVMSDRADDLSQLTVEIATTEFVDDVRTTGKITKNRYDMFLSTLGSTGNTYNVEMEIKVLDENPAIWKTDGENLFYSIYTSQIENRIYEGDGFKLKEGDVISVSVKNTNLTLKQQLSNFFYIVTGNNTYSISASHAGIVASTGV